MVTVTLLHHTTPAFPPPLVNAFNVHQSLMVKSQQHLSLKNSRRLAKYLRTYGKNRIISSWVGFLFFLNQNYTGCVFLPLFQIFGNSRLWQIFIFQIPEIPNSFCWINRRNYGGNVMLCFLHKYRPERERTREREGEREMIINPKVYSTWQDLLLVCANIAEQMILW